jgi:hypothetical protein
MDLGSTDQDALTTRVRSIFKGRDQFSLCGLLTVVGRRQGKGEPQRLRERARGHSQVGRLAGHHWPFLSDRLLDVLPNQPA